LIRARRTNQELIYQS